MSGLDVSPRTVGIVTPILGLAAGLSAWILWSFGGVYEFAARVMLGVTTGLLTASFVFWISRITPSRVPEMLRPVEDIPKIRDAVDHMSDMLDHRRHVVVEALVRGSLGADYYERQFDRAEYVDVSGLALTAFVRALCEVMPPNAWTNLDARHILRQIGRRGVHVRAILVHPDSDLAKERVAIEGVNAVGDIRRSIDCLRKLAEFLGTAAASIEGFRGRIEVKVARQARMPYSIFRTSPGRVATDFILLGVIPASSPGVMAPSLAVHSARDHTSAAGARGAAAFSEVCKRDFERLYTHRESTLLFRWTEDAQEFFDL